MDDIQHCAKHGSQTRGSPCCIMRPAAHHVALYGPRPCFYITCNIRGRNYRI